MWGFHFYIITFIEIQKKNIIFTWSLILIYSLVVIEFYAWVEVAVVYRLTKLK